jgi:hypothetical protein
MSRRAAAVGSTLPVGDHRRVVLREYAGGLGLRRGEQEEGMFSCACECCCDGCGLLVRVEIAGSYIRSL